MRKRKAVVRKRIDAVNEYGSEISTWEHLGHISGHMDFLTISKGEVAHKIMEDSTHIFIADTSLNIEQGDRLYVGDDAYDVNFVDRPMYGKRAEIELKPTLQNNDDMEQSIYYGVIAGTDVNESQLLGFDNQVIKKRLFSKELTVSAGNLFVAYPKSFGKASVRLNNTPVIWTITEAMVNGTLHFIYMMPVDAGTLHIDLF